jgi:hypothetical protein
MKRLAAPKHWMLDKLLGMYFYKTTIGEESLKYNDDKKKTLVKLNKPMFNDDLLFL